LHIESILRTIVFVSALLAVGAFLAGYTLGVRVTVPRRVWTGAGIVLAALLFNIALVAATRGAAAKIGPLVTDQANLVARAVGMALVGGYACGIVRRQNTSAAGVAIALVAVLVIVTLHSAFARNGEVIRVVRQLGLDEKVAKYEPEKNKDCPNNLKSLYIAFSMYTQDWGALPPAANWLDNEDLVSKVRQNEWLHCPAVSNRHDDKYGYAYNAAVAGRQLNGKPLNEMPDAAKTPLVYDSTNLAKNAHDAVTSLPHPGRHGGRNNILYCDGRVEAVAP
jgi:prepilin-type processing-associated H-X9-DG protein